MPHLPLMRWDYANRLQATAQQVVNSGTPETTYYTYDAAGRRVRKITERDALTGQAPRRKQERIYVDSEVFREYEADGVTVGLERESLHVIDDEHRVALVESTTRDTSIPASVFQVTTRLRYQVANHLGSSSMELDGNAQVIGYEEYFPYGGAAFHAAHSATEVSAKRYRYTSKEHDEETGLYYHGARYYAAWLGRWTSADPAGATAVSISSRTVVATRSRSVIQPVTTAWPSRKALVSRWPRSTAFSIPRVTALKDPLIL